MHAHEHTGFPPAMCPETRFNLVLSLSRREGGQFVKKLQGRNGFRDTLQEGSQYVRARASTYKCEHECIYKQCSQTNAVCARDLLLHPGTVNFQSCAFADSKLCAGYGFGCIGARGRRFLRQIPPIPHATKRIGKMRGESRTYLPSPGEGRSRRRDVSAFGAHRDGARHLLRLCREEGCEACA